MRKPKQKIAGPLPRACQITSLCGQNKTKTKTKNKNKNTNKTQTKATQTQTPKQNRTRQKQKQNKKAKVFNMSFDIFFSSPISFSCTDFEPGPLFLHKIRSVLQLLLESLFLVRKTRTRGVSPGAPGPGHRVLFESWGYLF